jgi:GNAT superfamily N-acetyltransferase
MFRIGCQRPAASQPPGAPLVSRVDAIVSWITPPDPGVALMPDTASIEILDPAAAPEVREAVHAGLGAYNDQHAPPGNTTPLVIAARSPEGQIIGGLVGVTAWGQTARGWMHVAMLWVTEGWRGRGVGRRLLRTAESEAVRRGCHFAVLDTFEFQARPFYEGEGYVVFGVLEGYPPGSRRFSMWKELAADAPA